jgi:hypothetical protein
LKILIPSKAKKYFNEPGVGNFQECIDWKILITDGWKKLVSSEKKKNGDFRIFLKGLSPEFCTGFWV